jgi:hypothetical protein
MAVLGKCLHLWTRLATVGTGVLGVGPVFNALLAEYCGLAPRAILGLLAEESQLLADHTLD